MRNLLLIFLCCGLYPCWSQHLHTPSELFALIQKSTIQYQEDSLFRTAEPAEWPLIKEGWRKNSETGEFQSPAAIFETQEEVQKYQLKANKYFEKNQFSKAVAQYQKAISENQGAVSPNLQKQLCLSFLKMGKSLDAGEALLPLLDDHQADFGLHFLLAEIHQQARQKELALKHITLAHLLNRNDTSLLHRLEQIYEENGLRFHKWYFSPQYQVSKNQNGGILVTYQSAPWRAYGLCRAVWEHEPAYAEKMKQLSNDPSPIIEQKECLLNALIAFEKLKLDQNLFPELQCLSKALPNNELDQFILYEISAREKPILICQLEETELLKLYQFVKTYHSSPIP